MIAFALFLSFSFSISLFPLTDTVHSLTEQCVCKECACAEHFDVERQAHTGSALLIQTSLNDLRATQQHSKISSLHSFFTCFWCFVCYVLLHLCVGQFLNISVAFVQNGVSAWACGCARAAYNAQNCYSRDHSCAWFTAYVLICSHGLSYHRIKYVNVSVEGSLWQRQPRLNTISLNEATQSAFTADTDSSLFGTSSVGLFGCLFMPLCESVWMKVRLRHGVYRRGVRMYLGALLYKLLCMHSYDYLCLIIFI